jgi:hypothetical protein
MMIPVSSDSKDGHCDQKLIAAGPVYNALALAEPFVLRIKVSCFYNARSM